MLFKSEFILDVIGCSATLQKVSQKVKSLLHNYTKYGFKKEASTMAPSSSL